MNAAPVLAGLLVVAFGVLSWAEVAVVLGIRELAPALRPIPERRLP